MLKSDPFVRQQSKVACNQQANEIRNTLYQRGKKLESQAQRALHAAQVNRDDVLISLGELRAYIQLRKSLSPTVAMDQFTHSLSGLTSKLHNIAFPEADLPASVDAHIDEQTGVL